MGRSLGFWVTGLTLMAGCAAGTELPTDHHIGKESPNGDSYDDDGGTAQPPGLDMPSGGGTGTGTGTGTGGASGSGSRSGSGSGGYGSGSGSSSSGSGGYGYSDGGSYYEGGSSYYEGGSSFDEGGSGTICMGYAPPSVTASCSACSSPPCQANGCYGGYWCDMTTSKCHSSPPSGC